MPESAFNWLLFCTYAGAGIFLGYSVFFAGVFTKHVLTSWAGVSKALALLLVLAVIPGFIFSAKVFLNTAQPAHALYWLAFALGAIYAAGTSVFAFADQASNSRLQATQ